MLRYGAEHLPHGGEHEARPLGRDPRRHRQPPLTGAARGPHPELLRGLLGIRDEIRADPVLRARIAEKFRIKNTTGYSLNAFVDFEDPVDILLHLLVGSEGTLAFIAEITYRTVIDKPHKASALAFFPDIGEAARATQLLSGGPVSAVELMDRASLRAVEGKPGMPSELRGLAEDAAALLIETRATDSGELAARTVALQERIATVPTLFPVAFTPVKAEYERLWDVRAASSPRSAGRAASGRRW